MPSSKENHMRNTIVLTLFVGAFTFSLRAQDQNARIEELSKKLKEAQQVAVSLQKTIDSLTDELDSLRNTGKPTAPQAAGSTPKTQAESEDEFKDQILVPDLGGDERSHRLTARPELFVQAATQQCQCKGLMFRQPHPTSN
jgi:uncharacterized coiled-coil protein SlyX